MLNSVEDSFHSFYGHCLCCHLLYLLGNGADDRDALCVLALVELCDLALEGDVLDVGGYRKGIGVGGKVLIVGWLFCGGVDMLL